MTIYYTVAGPSSGTEHVAHGHLHVDECLLTTIKIHVFELRISTTRDYDTTQWLTCLPTLSETYGMIFMQDLIPVIPA